MHPRPLLARPEWHDLCGEWQFAYDDSGAGLNACWQDPGRQHADGAFDRTIQVPYPPESRRSGIGDTGYHPVVWYRLALTADDLPARPPGHRLLLHLGAVDYEATVWCNGVQVGRHRGGQTPFSCDLTPALTGDAAGGSSIGGPSGATLVVRAHDDPHDVGQPRGKQDWEEHPHGIWYHRTTGIWQPVWLEVVPDLHVTELQWTPDLPASRVRAEVVLSRPPAAGHALEVVLRLDTRGTAETAGTPAAAEVVAELRTRLVEQRSVVDVGIPGLERDFARNRLLWSPASPTLLDARVRVVSDQDGAGGHVVDEVSSYVGLRSVGTEGPDLTVNGKAVYLRAVLAQGYWPDSHLAAPDEDALRREVELVKQLGFNCIRVHQKVEDPRFLTWCDRYGVLVWGETANALRFDDRAVERLTGEWLEVLRRDRSHPCIVAWVPHNESWGALQLATDPAQQAFVTALYHLTKAVDPSRPVVSNDGWEHTVSDIWTLHDYAPRGRLLTRRYGTRKAVQEVVRRGRVQRRRVVVGPGPVDTDRPVMLTEFGGIRHEAGPRADGWGYSEAGSPQGLLDRLDDLVGAVLASPGFSGFCYTQLADTEQEQNGLLTADRTPKAPRKQIHRIITQPRGEPRTGDRELAGRHVVTTPLRWARAVRARRAEAGDQLSALQHRHPS